MPDQSPTKSAAQAFAEAQRAIVRLSAAASALPGLTDVERGQMRMIAGVAGLQFPPLSAAASPAELRGVVKDLEAFYRHVDPLIETIGIDAACSANGIDKSFFRRRLEGALDDALSALFDAAAGIEESDRDDDDAMWRGLRAAAQP